MSGIWMFVGLIFLAVFLLTFGLTSPVFGENRQARKRLLARLAAAGSPSAGGQAKMLLREKYLKELTPFERSLEALPGMEALASLIEQAGRSGPAYRLVIKAVALGAGAWIAGGLLLHLWYGSALLGLAVGSVPFLLVLRERKQRTAKFDEQFPEALDVVKRALKAGHPFTQCLKLVAEDMDKPVSREFEYIFAEINYGSDLRGALLGLLERIPSVSAMAFVTAVLVQKETGGNLAETLERITSVIRGRFKLHRRVRTLSADGRLSAWILMLIPLALFAVMWFTAPGYLPTLIHDPRGPKLIEGAVVLGVIGMFWIRRIIRIRV